MDVSFLLGGKVAPSLPLFSTLIDVVVTDVSSVTKTVQYDMQII